MLARKLGIQVRVWITLHHLYTACRDAETHHLHGAWWKTRCHCQDLGVPVCKDSLWALNSSLGTESGQSHWIFLLPFKHLKFLLALLTTQITLLYTIYLGVIPC